MVAKRLTTCQSLEQSELRTNDRAEGRQDSWGGKSEGERNKNVERRRIVRFVSRTLQFAFPFTSIQTLHAHVPSSPPTSRLSLLPLTFAEYSTRASRGHVCAMLRPKGTRRNNRAWERLKRIARPLKRVSTTCGP